MIPLVRFKIYFRHREMTPIGIHGAMFFLINILTRRLSRKKQMVSLPHEQNGTIISVSLPPKFTFQTQAQNSRGNMKERCPYLRQRWSSQCGKGWTPDLSLLPRTLIPVARSPSCSPVSVTRQPALPSTPYLIRSWPLRDQFYKQQIWFGTKFRHRLGILCHITLL